jgi:hypothetical protein
MKMRMRLIAAVGVAAAVMLPAADAGAALGGQTSSSFAPVVTTSVQPLSGGTTALPVKCQPGSSTGTSTGSMFLSLSPNTAGANSIGSFGNAKSVKAIWPGGSMWLTRVGRTYKTSKSTRFPCPATNTAPMTVTFQPYRGSKKVGSAAVTQTSVGYVGPRVVRQFAAWPSVDTIDLSCKPSTMVKSLTTLKLEATRNLNGTAPANLGDDLNKATSLRATWNGGSATLQNFGPFYAVSSASRFPCPDPAKPDSRQLSITVQGYRGALKVGAPAHINLGLFNVSAPASHVEAGTVTGSNGGTVGSTSQPATSSDPIQASVTLPPGVSGPVVIKESATSSKSAPSGYTFFGSSVHIDAPPATAANPLVLTFRFYAPVGTVNEKTVKIFRNGVAAGECPGGTTANPDACVKSRSRIGDNVVLTVNTSHASDWDGGKVTGAPS